MWKRHRDASKSATASRNRRLRGRARGKGIATPRRARPRRPLARRARLPSGKGIATPRKSATSPRAHGGRGAHDRSVGKRHRDASKSAKTNRNRNRSDSRPAGGKGIATPRRARLLASDRHLHGIQWKKASRRLEERDHFIFVSPSPSSPGPRVEKASRRLEERDLEESTSPRKWKRHRDVAAKVEKASRRLEERDHLQSIRASRRQGLEKGIATPRRARLHSVATGSARDFLVSRERSRLIALDDAVPR
jgi:hypothetical protein